MTIAVRLAILMFVNYCLNAASFRLLARGSYLGVGITDGLIAWWGFTMTKLVVQADTRLQQVGYVIGGVSGSLVGLWLTK